MSLRPDHTSAGCRCPVCQQLRSKTKEPEVWLAEHAAHGDKALEPFLHPDGRMYWLVCPCGARYLTMEKSDGD